MDPFMIHKAIRKVDKATVQNQLAVLDTGCICKRLDRIMFIKETPHLGNPIQSKGDPSPPHPHFGTCCGFDLVTSICHHTVLMHFSTTAHQHQDWWHEQIRRSGSCGRGCLWSSLKMQEQGPGASEALELLPMWDTRTT